MVAFMLRPLSTEQAEARRLEFGIDKAVQPDAQHYKCIYWDEDTRLCGAYGDRPQMCSEYPYPLTPANTDAWGRTKNEHGIGAGVCDHGCDCKGAPLLCECEDRSEEHTSELQSLRHLVCRL